jgi:hypothetical protein
MCILAPRPPGYKWLIYSSAIEVERLAFYYDFSCDLASVYKNPRPKTRSIAMKFTSENIYLYCSRSDGSSPPKSLEQLGLSHCLKQRCDQEYNCFAQNQNQESGMTLTAQGAHGVSSVSDSVSPTTNATTVFVSDAAVVTTGVNHSLGPTLNLAKKSQIPNVEDIKKFLAKPIVIRTGIFSSTDSYSTVAPITAMRTFCTQPITLNKLAGFAGIRATMVFRIVLNANRFQQGRYQMSWVPTGGEVAGNRLTEFIQAHTSTRTQRSQLHRVEVDLNCDTEGELVVPFTSVMNWYPLRNVFFPTTVAGDLGVLCLFPYSALQASSGSLNAGYKIYMHLEDVELFGATVPQMGKKLTRVVKRNASEIEAKNANVGPVESAMAMGNTISNALTAVPFMAPFAKPASWVFQALEGVAATFGWSKPLNLDQAKRVIMQNAPYLGSVNNDDYSLPLSLDVSNYIEPIALGLNDIDEMDFNSLVSIPTWVSTSPFTTSNLEGDNLYNVNLSPSVGIVATGIVTHHTPMSLVASYFNLWRGGFYIKVKVVKTEFHSGRISLSFNPYCVSGANSAPAGPATLPFLQRTIYDLRECNEIIYHVPFNSAYPFLRIPGTAGAKETSIGNFAIHVEDILVAPATVPSTIDLIIEIYGAPDMEFAYPAPQSWTPNYAVIPQMGEPLQRNDCRLDSGSVLPFPMDSVEAASKCVGEKVRSFRSLIKAYSTVNDPTPTPKSNFNVYSPFYCPVRLGAATPTEPANYSDLYGTLHGCFLYSRGGVRLALHPRDTATDEGDRQSKGLLTVTRNLQLSSPVRFLLGTDSLVGNINRLTTNGLKVLGCTTDDQPIQVAVPALGSHVARLCNEYLIPPESSVLLRIDAGAASYIGHCDVVTVGPTMNTVISTLKRSFVAYRAGADDCDFSYFISVMPMSKNLGQ